MTICAADDSGQATLLLLGALAAVLIGAIVLGGVARGIGVQGRDQRAADLAALAGANALSTAYPRIFEPAVLMGRPNPAHLERAAYERIGRQAALRVAASNGADAVAVSYPQREQLAPTRIRVDVRDPAHVTLGGVKRVTAIHARADAELSPYGGELAGLASGGGYSGPLAYRQGKPMRPDVAISFDRMAAEAQAAGVSLTVVSGFRSDAEQAVLFARHPDPQWVARPGRSLHRLGTELDLGPASAYGWLATHAPAFGFIKRYAWEPWHFGFSRNAGSTSVGYGRGGDGRSAIPAFVPSRFAPALSRAAQRWNVSAALLAAQIYAESGFNPFAVSSAGAQGIAQFMPATARGYGLSNPFDASAAINAQAHLMHDLLRRFGAVPLALAAYNAGAGAVSRCGCVPANGETPAYVTRILGLLKGVGDSSGLASGLRVRLVR